MKVFLVTLLVLGTGQGGPLGPSPRAARTSDLVVVGTLSELAHRRLSVSYHLPDGSPTMTSFFDLGTIEVEEVLKGKIGKVNRVVILIPSADRPEDKIVHASPPQVHEGQHAIWILDISGPFIRYRPVLTAAWCVIPVSMKAEVLEHCSAP